MRIKMFNFTATIAVAAISIVLAAKTTGEVHDIVCSASKTTYAQPGECIPKCPIRLGNFIGCALSPTCPGFDASDQNLRVFYNAAAFGRGRISDPKRVLVSHLVNRYFSPFKANELNISISAEMTHAWARIMVHPETQEKLPLEVAESTFRTSPAYLATSIGHELIHVEQLRRSYPAPPTNFERATVALWELEAASWEAGNDKIKHKISPNAFGSCLIPEEKRDSEVRLTCSLWNTKSAVRDVLNSPRGSVYGPRLLKWIDADPWAKIWRSEQKDLREDPGEQPDICKDAPGRGQK